ncbi:adenosylcobalamin-dependent ribonucleoside-diphosphate reductase [Candidatus Woesearchaeota archaeon]|nr:adenosylcobalamin-dependent ribonucleoside-diphosphate reductase [Candidatus Woesearchaeota archaeon]
MPIQHYDFQTLQNIKKEVLEKGKKNNFRANSNKIWEKRYLKINPDNSKETIEDRVAGIAVDVATADVPYYKKTNMNEEEILERVKNLSHQFYAMMIEGRFLPNTPTIINFFRWKKKNGGFVQRDQMGSACFVLPIEDNLGTEEPGEGITDAAKHQALIHKDGGGTGFALHKLRPAGSLIEYDPEIHKSSFGWESSIGIASGPLSFWEHILDAGTNAIKQGNTRRGANMAIMRVDHPDFLDIMYAKFGSEKRIKNFNVSMALTDEFMKAVINGTYYRLFNPHTKTNLKKIDLCPQKRFQEILEENKKNPFNPVTTPSIYLAEDGKTLINAYRGTEIGIVIDEVLIDARRVIEEIAKLAASNGEPGVFFIDRANMFNPTPLEDRIEATNPCGEQPIPPNDACNLGSHNLAKYVKFDKEKPDFDFDFFGGDIELSVRLLDNVIDRNDFPLKRITEKVMKERKIGPGFMGMADALMLLGLKYGSKEANEMVGRWTNFFAEKTAATSEILAKEKGTFGAWKGSIYDPKSEAYKDLIATNPPMKHFYGKPRRNSYAQTQAPTGTISRLAGCSSGIEPTFSLTMVSNVMNTNLFDVSPGMIEALIKAEIFTPEIKNYIDEIKIETKWNGLYNEGFPVFHKSTQNLEAQVQLLKAISDNGGVIEVNKDTPNDIRYQIEIIPKSIRDILITSSEVNLEGHLSVQEICQKWNDSAISKTLNLPSNATPADVVETYIEMWKRGLKGGTVYIDKSRSFQILNRTNTASNGKAEYQRPLLQEAITIELPLGNPFLPQGEHIDEEKTPRVFVTIAYDPISKKINSIFGNTSTGTAYTQMDTIAMTKSWSRILKLEGNPHKLIKELEQLPAPTHRGSLIPPGGNYSDRLETGTLAEAVKQGLYALRFLTDDFTNFGEIRKRYSQARDSLKNIINAKGILVKDNGERPNIFGSDLLSKLDLMASVGDHCPYCHATPPNARVIEGCIKYECCGESKCNV